jgi:PKD repeat protein
VFIAAPLLAQGSDDDRCGPGLPVADAASLGCPIGGTIDELVQGDDEVVWVDANGAEFVADPIDHLAASDTAPAPITAERARADLLALPDLSDALRLHSRPGAPRTLYIDVDGHVTSASGWNSIAGGTIVSAPFDMDGDPTRFSTLERTVIRSVWQRVSEDYAPFDVNVTTEDPGLAALTRSGDDDANFGVRMIVTSSNWYGSGVGGLAYLGSFDDALPAFVFSDSLGNVDRYIAEAVTHEAGHTLGLRHDGTATSGYYTGHGGWAPIMGVGYEAEIVQWSKGEYAGANNTEDDIAIIATYIPLVSDEHGDTADTATPIALGETADGVISTAADVDAFVIDIASGTATFDAHGSPVASNLDLRLRLLHGDGRRLATSNPASRLGATITRELTAGRYVVLVDGVGKGDPTTGYSDYGSLGRFTLTSRLDVTQSAARPTARIVASDSTVYPGERVVFDGRTSTDADGGSVNSYRWQIDAPTARTLSGPVSAHTWSTPGTYDVRLTVVGDDGRRNTATRSITVLRPRKALVRDVTLRATADSSSRLSLAVRDGRGRPVASARISVAWSGAASGTSTAITNSRGRATVTTVVPTRTGSVSALVQRVRPPVGFVWDGRRVSATRAL